MILLDIDFLLLTPRTPRLLLVVGVMVADDDDDDNSDLTSAPWTALSIRAMTVNVAVAETILIFLACLV